MNTLTIIKFIVIPLLLLAFLDHNHEIIKLIPLAYGDTATTNEDKYYNYTQGMFRITIWIEAFKALAIIVAAVFVIRFKTYNNKSDTHSK